MKTHRNTVSVPHTFTLSRHCGCQEPIVTIVAHAGSQTRVTSMGGLYDAATLRALVQVLDQRLLLAGQLGHPGMQWTPDPNGPMPARAVHVGAADLACMLE